MTSTEVPQGLGQCRTAIKGTPSPYTLIHFSLSPLPPLPQETDMSCPEKCQQCQPCNPCCQPCGPCPLANSCNECCVRQCQSSTVVIEPPTVLVTLPGPILSSFPQNTVVGSSTSAAVGSILSCDGVPISSGGFDISCITRGYGERCCRPC
ncbi:feather keratin Cos1-1/Cos1-3/Cos2-1-like [Cinclus cinclus]|uniref:feather keratin Cos1-1/Cos1-3/Cos2-1-like n=2 Tax=Cinclus cinclus TaxID=127875 RepID=UPI002E0E323B